MSTGNYNQHLPGMSGQDQPGARSWDAGMGKQQGAPPFPGQIARPLPPDVQGWQQGAPSYQNPMARVHAQPQGSPQGNPYFQQAYQAWQAMRGAPVAQQALPMGLDPQAVTPMQGAAQAAALGYGGRPNLASPVYGGAATGVTPKALPLQPVAQPLLEQQIQPARVPTGVSASRAMFSR